MRKFGSAGDGFLQVGSLRGPLFLFSGVAEKLIPGSQSSVSGGDVDSLIFLP